MKRLLLLGAIIWTYGSEPLDYLVENTEYMVFMSQLQCKVKNEHVYCKVEGEWYTIANEPLQIPWGL